MSSLNSLYIKKETLQTLLDTVVKKKDKGVELTIALSDDGGDYGQNVSAFVSQSKEQREANAKRFYVGNGKTFWTKGETPIPPKKDIDTPKEAPKSAPQEDTYSDLPF